MVDPIKHCPGQGIEASGIPMHSPEDMYSAIAMLY